MVDVNTRYSVIEDLTTKIDQELAWQQRTVQEFAEKRNALDQRKISDARYIEDQEKLISNSEKNFQAMKEISDAKIESIRASINLIQGGTLEKEEKKP